MMGNRFHVSTKYEIWQKKVYILVGKQVESDLFLPHRSKSTKTNESIPITDIGAARKVLCFPNES